MTLNAREEWATKRPLCAAEIARNAEVAEIVLADGRDCELNAENLTWVWGIYIELEKADPIIHLQQQAKDAWNAAFPG